MTAEQELRDWQQARRGRAALLEQAIAAAKKYAKAASAAQTANYPSATTKQWDMHEQITREALVALLERLAAMDERDERWVTL